MGGLQKESRNSRMTLTAYFCHLCMSLYIIIGHGHGNVNEVKRSCLRCYFMTEEKHFGYFAKTGGAT